MNEECPYLEQRDAMWHGVERHDLYCSYHLTWCPQCEYCQLNEQEEDDER